MSAPTLPPPRCFQGVVPALIATAAPDGTPNVTYLSQVFLVDERHVALSCQFFNKTKQNVLGNPQASVDLYDPVTFELWQLDLRYVREEKRGPLFDTMSMRIDAIASHTGMSDVFRLVSADIYEIVRCERVEGFIEVPEVPEADDPGGPGELRALQLVSQRVCRAHDLDELLGSVLEGLETGLGFHHVMLLVPDETGARLYTVASRGYGEAGIGAEVAVGEGLIGIVAQGRRVLRLSNMEDELRYGRAIRSSAEHTGLHRTPAREIPLPGLPDAQSQLALPLVAGDELMGVLAVESRERLGFAEWHEAFLEIIANQVAMGMQSVLLRERAREDRSSPTPAPVPVPTVGPDVAVGSRRFRFFPQDDCVFVDDDYLIRNVPGRILWKLLRAHVEQGRTDFSNRELRLDPWIGLPRGRDNLESRLVLLRRRLELKCPELGLLPTSRGHFRLRVNCTIALEPASVEAPQGSPA